MKKYKKIISLSIWIFLIVAIIVCEGFASKKQDLIVCGIPSINIVEDGELLFLNKMDVIQLLRDAGDSIVGQPKSSVDILKIKRILSEHPDVAKAEISMSVEGELKIIINQRKPLIHVITKTDDEYYIDETGRLMPLSDRFTGKVLVANGNIFESYSKNYLENVGKISTDTAPEKESILEDLYVLSKFVNADKFWKLQIQQVYVNEDNEMELIPLVGNHKIIFGDTVDMQKKFSKLKTFYLEGLNPTGNWEKYSTINLKYNNQIVCTKK